MTIEQYESLSLQALKDIARSRGLKKISALRKNELIELMLEEDKKLEMKDSRETGKIGSDNTQEEIKSVSDNIQEKKKVISGISREKNRIRTDRTKEKNVTETESLDDEKKTGKKDLEEYKKAETQTSQNEGAETSTDSRSNELDSGICVEGFLEVLSEGYGFIRSEGFFPGENDVYVSPSQIKRFGLRTGDIIKGNTRIRNQNEKFSALLYISSINNADPELSRSRLKFEKMTPIFPRERIRLETGRHNTAMRIVDIISPIGKGQRGMIVAPPKAGKTTLLKNIALSIKENNPEVHLIILLIDERPEEVTDIKETIVGDMVEVVSSTFDELPERHKRVAEMTIEKAKRLTESGQDVVLLLDSITRLTRAYNITISASGRTLSGGLDPAALYMPKRFFGAARNLRESGSLTILATALIDTGSKMDDVIYEEFKGTGNMELILDRKLQEKRVFPAIDIAKSGTRRDDLLLTKEESYVLDKIHRGVNGSKSEEVIENLLNCFSKTRSNKEFIAYITKTNM